MSSIHKYTVNSGDQAQVYYIKGDKNFVAVNSGRCDGILLRKIGVDFGAALAGGYKLTTGDLVFSTKETLGTVFGTDAGEFEKFMDKHGIECIAYSHFDEVAGIGSDGQYHVQEDIIGNLEKTLTDL